jgi:hypothetical protein
LASAYFFPAELASPPISVLRSPKLLRGLLSRG